MSRSIFLLTCTAAVATAAVVPDLVVGAPAPACDLTKSGKSFCKDFCSGKCGFYNTSAGETGLPETITVYRITPRNVTGLVNKNNADAPGDLSFVITKKNITQQCLHDPTSMGCNTDMESKDMYGEFRIEVSGQWGPYQLCNPANGWDTGNWFCGQECFQPTEKGCGTPFEKLNGTGFDNGPMCWCERTRRSVGRELAPGAQGMFSYMPPFYPPQCAGGFKPLPDTGCIDGGADVKPYKTLHAWSFDSAASMACQACYADAKCNGWRSLDNRTVELFNTRIRNTSLPAGKTCVGAFRHRSRWGGSNWFGITQLGGCVEGKGCSNVWYSTTKDAQCPEGKPLGTNGCSWRLVATVGYKNASCIDSWADRAVESHGRRCFQKCPHPLDKNTNCYLDCYRNTLMGDASQNLTRMPPASFLKPWKHAMQEDDPAKGGCPKIKPITGPLSVE